MSSVYPVPIGQYVKINTNKGDILGLVSKSGITSRILEDKTHVDEIKDCCDILKEQKRRDKSYISSIDILGYIDGIDKGNKIIPATAVDPGTDIVEPTDQELYNIFNPDNEKWGRIGTLLRNEKVPVKFNIDKIVSRHLGVLAMTGMGKSNLVSLITKRISEKNGTVIIFDYHKDYDNFSVPNIEYIDAKINPRKLDAEEFADIIEIRSNADKQRSVIRYIFNEVVNSKNDDFWGSIETMLINRINAEKKQDLVAERVLDIVRNAKFKFQNILDPSMSNDTITYIKEQKINIVNISELSESQANIVMSFYLRNILIDCKNATIKSDKKYHFSDPVFCVIEEAHVFAPKEDTKSKYQISKIAREGRKFGVGLCIVSQRPRSMDENVLSQMGSFAIMKIIQDSDQNQIANATESANRELIDQLTSLNVGDAILLGQWCNLTSLVHIDPVKEKSAGADRSAIDAWSKRDKMNINDSTSDLIEKDLLR